MFINPKTAIKEGWIQFPSWMSEEQQQKCVQPNAIDFTLDKLFIVDPSSTARVSETQKTLRKVVEHVPTDGEWTLQPDHLYDGMSDFYVKVPDNVAAMLIIRSSFNRIGLQLNSGLYDSFFWGNIGFTLFNRSGPIITSPGTRIGQIIFILSDAAGRYVGGYNTEFGQHWTLRHIHKSVTTN